MRSPRSGDPSGLGGPVPRRRQRRPLHRWHAGPGASRARVRPPFLLRRPRDRAPVPPPKREGSVPTSWPRTAYVLRNRHVPATSNRPDVADTSNRKPYVPARYEKREKLNKHDRPRSSRRKLKQDEPWEATSCARAGLEHYNSMNQGDEHELVKAVSVHPFIWCGVWLHANFLARRKGASNCVDLVPKYFFAELKLDGSGLSCASCVKIDSAEPTISYCGVCPRKIMHPAAGVYLGAQTRRIQPAETGIQISFSF
uniref:Uncharacterized protein n=1 Tax=Avena sativa TaxID=4498 RepID=A0ACD5ZBN5_AVESA